MSQQHGIGNRDGRQGRKYSPPHSTFDLIFSGGKNLGRKVKANSDYSDGYRQGVRAGRSRNNRNRSR